jgi:hypothetical protein
MSRTVCRRAAWFDSNRMDDLWAEALQMAEAERRRIRAAPTDTVVEDSPETQEAGTPSHAAVQRDKVDWRRRWPP